MDKEDLINVLGSRNRALFSKLELALQSKLMSFEMVSKINEQGLYLVFEADKIVYVGKTTRSGKVRLTELASDFRSHTLNKKLLTIKFKELGFVFKVLKSQVKKDWIESGIISEIDFKSHQRSIYGGPQS